jgi:ATP-dependent Zn protease
VGSSTSPRQRAAVHESAHAVIALAHGATVVELTVHPTTGAGMSRTRNEPLSKFDRAVISLAGDAAERLSFANTSSGDDHDFEDALDLVPGDVIAAQTRARNLVGDLDTFRAVQRVAAELVARGTLTGDDVDRAIERGN